MLTRTVKHHARRKSLKEKLTPQEFTEYVLNQMEEIRRLYYLNHPDGDYMTFTIHKDAIDFNNRYWKDDKEYPINGFKGYDNV